MLCSSMRRRASLVAACASCAFALVASASKRMTRLTIGFGPGAAPPPTTGTPAAVASMPRARQTSTKAGPCAVSSWIPRTSSTYWWASSCLSTSRTAPQAWPKTSARDSDIVRVARSQAPSRRPPSLSASAGGRIPRPKWFCASSAQVWASSRKSAASSAVWSAEGLTPGALTTSRADRHPSVAAGPERVDAAHARVAEDRLDDPAAREAVLDVRLVLVGVLRAPEDVRVRKIDPVADVLADLDTRVGVARALALAGLLIDGLDAQDVEADLWRDLVSQLPEHRRRDRGLRIEALARRRLPARLPREDQAHDLRLVVDGRIAREPQVRLLGRAAQLDDDHRLGELALQLDVELRVHVGRAVEGDVPAREVEALALEVDAPALDADRPRQRRLPRARTRRDAPDLEVAHELEVQVLPAHVDGARAHTDVDARRVRGGGALRVLLLAHRREGRLVDELHVLVLPD